MSRLTRKTNGKDYYTHCNYIEKTNEIFGRGEKPLTPNEYYEQEPYKVEDSYYDEDILVKLGKLEDLLEKYQVDSIEELEEIIKRDKKSENEIIELSADLGLYQNENTSLTKDIEKYWQIEQELGCPLEVVFKKIQELTIECWEEVHCLQYDEDKKLWYIISYSLWDDEFCPNGNYYLKDYQKTWWLKGERECYEKV